MTKPVTGVALMQLLKGFQLSDPVSKFLPEFNNQQVYVSGSTSLYDEPVKRPMVIRDLLTHTWAKL